MPAVGYTPTLLLADSARIAVRQIQRDLVSAQQEATTGRYADVGLALGAEIGSALRLRLDISELDHAADSARSAASTAAASQSALKSINDLSANVLSMLTAIGSAEDGQSMALESGRAAYESLRALINTSFGGQYIFGGQNTSDEPLKSFDAGPSQMVDDAFEAAFGFPSASTGTSGISPADMEQFMEGPLESLFAPSQWTAGFSNAAADNMRVRLDGNIGVDVTSNANAGFVPKLAQAFAMLFKLGEGQLSDSTFQSIVNRSMTLIADAQQDIGAEQARIGISQNRLSSHIEVIEARSSVATSALHELEGVDPYEAATRINSLMTQLESSYAITARLSRMSLLQYI